MRTSTTIFLLLLLSLSGRLRADELPKEGMLLWFDAAHVEVKEGVVEQLTDLSGQGNHAKHDRGPKYVPINPSVAKDADSGRPVLRFTGQTTSFSFKPLDNIRTVFWVVSKNPAAFKGHNELFVLGDHKGRDFHVGTHFTDTIIERGGNASRFLKEGGLWFNGFPSDPTLTEFPTRLAVISMVTSGDVRADQIARDREFWDRSWNGDIAEIILYRVPLGEKERKQVETYLLHKYAITPFKPVVVTPEAIAHASAEHANNQPATKK